MIRGTVVILILLLGCLSLHDRPTEQHAWPMAQASGRLQVPAQTAAAPAPFAAAAIPHADDLSSSSEPLSLQEVRQQSISILSLPTAVDRSLFRRYVDADGITRLYQPGLVLLKFRDRIHPSALAVPEGTELATVAALPTHGEIEYAELNVLHSRQFQPSDPRATNQWHHALLGSTNAWELSVGHAPVTVAIVDTPFQMDHPDLAANTVPGFDLVKTQAVTSAPGFFHSTIAAGLAGGVIDNFIGISGVVNCKLMPIDIGDFPDTATMYKSVVWAADNGVRVVNLSWDGAYSSLINTGAEYLEQTTRGVVLMAGTNGEGRFVNYVNQPKIWAISMTDRLDKQRSVRGPHIDFTAPGYDIYSTTEGSSYEIDSGSSYSTPLFAGIVAWVMSVNPALNPPDIFELLKQSSIDLGTPGRDDYHGWGRVDLALLSRNIPLAHKLFREGNRFSVEAIFIPNANYSFLSSPSLNPPQWKPVDEYLVETNGSFIYFHDESGGLMRPESYYQVKVVLH